MVDKAAGIIRIYVGIKRQAGSGSAKELLAYIETIYDNPNKVKRAVADLSKLRQRKTEPFSEFLPRFETLLAEAGGAKFPAIIQINYLQNAINMEMQRAFIFNDLPDNYADFTAKLQDIGNKMQRFGSKSKRAPMAAITAGDSQPDAMDWELTKIAKEKQ